MFRFRALRRILVNYNCWSAFENVFLVYRFHYCLNSPIWSTCKLKIYLLIKDYILSICDKILPQVVRMKSMTNSQHLVLF